MHFAFALRLRSAFFCCAGAIYPVFLFVRYGFLALALAYLRYRCFIRATDRSCTLRGVVDWAGHGGMVLLMWRARSSQVLVCPLAASLGFNHKSRMVAWYGD